MSKHQLRTQWNTGNHYSEHGQRIVAVLTEDNRVLVHDLERYISGELIGTMVGGVQTKVPHSIETEADLRRYVTDNYVNDYGWTVWAGPEHQDPRELEWEGEQA